MRKNKRIVTQPPDKQELMESLTSRSSDSMGVKAASFVKRTQGEEVTPFSPLLKQSPQSEINLSGALKAEWTQLYKATKDVSFDPGAAAFCPKLLAERKEFFCSLALSPPRKESDDLPSALVQLFLITLRDAAGELSVFLASEERPEHCTEEMCKLLSLARFFVLKDASRMMLSQDFLKMCLGFYALLTKKMTNISPKVAADMVRVFFEWTKTISSLGELVSRHLSLFPHLRDFLSTAAKSFAAALEMIHSNADIQSLAKTQFLFFACKKLPLVTEFDFLGMEYVDLHLVLMVAFLATAKETTANLYEMYSHLYIGAQLEVLDKSISEFLLFTETLPEAMCLVDKFLLVLYFIKVAIHSDKSTAVRAMKDYGAALARATMNCCVIMVKWECPLYEQSYGSDTGRLGNLFSLLMAFFEPLIDTEIEGAPLDFFSDFEERLLTEQLKQPTGIQTYTLELVKKYVQQIPANRVYQVLYGSKILNYLLTPAFLRLPEMRKSSPFDSHVDLGKLAGEYVRELLEIVGQEEEGRNFIVQELIQNMLQHHRIPDFLTSVSTIICLMVSSEESDIVQFLREKRFVDMLFQLILEHMKASRDLQSVEALKVMTLHLLEIHDLAVSALEQTQILYILEHELLSHSEFAEFAVLTLARLLATNASPELFQRYVRLIKLETNTDVLKLLVQGVEWSVRSQNRQTTQALFAHGKLISVLIKKMEQMHSQTFSEIVLPALKVVLFKSDVAKRKMRVEGFSRLRAALALTIYEGEARDDSVSNIMDNLLFIMLESPNLQTVTALKVPELASSVMAVLSRISDEALQTKYLTLLLGYAKADEYSAYALSKYGMLQGAFRLFAAKHNKSVKSLSLELIEVLIKEECGVRDVAAAISIINDDTKVSFPSDMTFEVLRKMRTALAIERSIKVSGFFTFRENSRIAITGLSFPGTRGFSVCFWLNSHDRSATVLSFSNLQTKELISVSFTQSRICVKHSHERSEYSAFANASVANGKWNFVVVSFVISGAICAAQIFVNGEKPKHVIDGQCTLTKAAFSTAVVGACDGPEANYHGCLSTILLFKRPLTSPQIQELKDLGPALPVPFNDLFYRQKSVPFNSNLREIVPKLILSLHPLGRSLGSIVNTVASSRSEVTENQTMVVSRHFVSDSLCALGGVKLLWVLLDRLATQPYALDQLLEEVLIVTAEVLRNRCEYYAGELRGGGLIQYLACVLRKVAKRASFDIAVATLLVRVVDVLEWDADAQCRAIESILMSTKLWRRADISVQSLVISRPYSQLYKTEAAKSRLVTLLMNFACELYSPAIAQKVISLLKGEIGCEDVGRVVFALLAESQNQRSEMTESLLKYCSFIAKRGQLRINSDYLKVLFHCLLEDWGKETKVSHMVLRILKMTVIVASGENDSVLRRVGRGFELKFQEFANVDIFQLLDSFLHPWLTDSEYIALTSLMFFVPTMSPESHRRSVRFPELSCKTYFSKIIAIDDGVVLRFPAALELLTKRLKPESSIYQVQDITHIAKKHAECFVTAESFPAWVLKLLEKGKSLRDTAWSGLIVQLTATIFGQALFSQSCPDLFKKLRQFCLSLARMEAEDPEQCTTVAGILSIIMTYIVSQTTTNMTLELMGSLHELAFVLEDLMNNPETRHFILPHICDLALKLSEVARTYRLFSCTFPRVPIVTFARLIELYRPAGDSVPELGRDGGLVRVLLKCLFLALDVTPDRAEPVFLYLGLIIAANDASADESSRTLAAQLFDSKPYLFTGQKRDTDLLSSPKHLRLLVFSEVVDTVLRHSSDVEFLPKSQRFLKSLLPAFESAIDSILLEKSPNEAIDYAELNDLTGSFGWSALYLPSLPEQATLVLSQKEFVRAKDNIIAKATKDLRQAIADTPERLKTVLCSQDWSMYVNPYVVARTGKGVSVVDWRLRNADLWGKVEGVVDTKDSAQTHRILALKNRLECFIQHSRSLLSYSRHAETHIAAYHKALWKRFLKYHTTLGFWSMPQPSNPVLKVDPELDLELKSMRLRPVKCRSREYYIEKAHHKTKQAMNREEEKQNHRPRRSLFLERKSEGKKDFHTLANESSYPAFAAFKGRTETSLEESGGEEEDLEPMKDWAFECERIQTKGAMFGVMEVSPAFLYYKGANKKKPTDPKYFGGALAWAEIIGKKTIVLPLADVNEAFVRRFNQRQTAIELYTNKGRSYYFNLFTEESLAKLKAVLSQYLQGKKHFDPVRNFQDLKLTTQWRNGLISNFEYLMAVNRFASRSFNDVNQYPVFPWVLKNYSSSTLTLSSKEELRDLSRPIGAQTEYGQSEARRRYEQFLDDVDVSPHHFGSHYSSGGTVLHYLVRLEPFTSQAILMQDGQFDVADRLFVSVPAAYQGCTNNSGDCKELVPELFYLPEVLQNLNNYPLGRSQEGETVHDVFLPPWSHSAFSFIRKHRQALESPSVSEALSEWIDLIFGFRQKGENAEKALNVFLDSTYEENAKELIIEAKESPDLAGNLDLVVLYGQTPVQLFTTKHPKRVVRIQETLFDHLSTERDAMVRSLGVSESSHGKVKLVSVGRYGALIVCEDFSIKNWKNRAPGGEYEGEGEAFSRLESAAKSVHSSYFPDQCALMHGSFIVTGMHQDFSIRVHHYERLKLAWILPHHRDLVTCVYADGDYLLAGSKDTTLSLWRLSLDPEARLADPEFQFPLLCHRAALRQARFNWTLQVAASLSDSREVLIHSLRSGECVRRLDNMSTSLIALGPLGVIALYSRTANEISVVTVNSTSVARFTLSSPPLNISTSVRCLSFTPASDGLIFCTRSKLHVLSLFDEFPLLTLIEYGENCKIDCFALADDGKSIQWTKRDSTSVQVMEMSKAA